MIQQRGKKSDEKSIRRNKVPETEADLPLATERAVQRPKAENWVFPFPKGSTKRLQPR